jgi:hypothetical protein
MRKILVFLVCIIQFPDSGCQSWEIFNTQLRAERKGSTLEVSTPDRRKSLVIEADSAFLDMATEMLFFKKDGLAGIIDPGSLELLNEASFTALVKVSENFFLVHDREGSYFSRNEFPIKPVLERFTSVHPFSDNVFPHFFIAERKGKFGLVSTENGVLNYLVKPEYDEILPEKAENEAIFYYLRKGKKWGSGSCEGVEVQPGYDRIRLLKGECMSAIYLVWKKGLCGIVYASDSKPLADCIYQIIEYKEAGNEDFLLFFSSEGLSELGQIDMFDKSLIYYEPLMVLKISEKNKTLLVYKDQDGLSSLEFSEQEAERLGLQSLEWLFIEN